MNILLKNMTIILSLIAGVPAMQYDNNNPGNCSPEVISIFLTEVIKDNYIEHDFPNFLESVRPLREVCKEWEQLIGKKFMHETMVLGCKQICPEFLRLKLVFRPNEGNDEEMVELKVSDLWNPRESEFPLEECKRLYAGIDWCADEFLSISTGFPQRKKTENTNKLQIWFTLRSLVGADIFWIWDGITGKDCYDFLTIDNMENLPKVDLYKNWKKSKHVEQLSPWSHALRKKRSPIVHAYALYTRFFKFCCDEEIEINQQRALLMDAANFLNSTSPCERDRHER